MNKELLVLLTDILGPGRSTTDNNYIYHCPFCNHKKKKLEIDSNTEQWHCWVCGAKGKTLSGLFKKLDANQVQVDKLKSLTNKVEFTGHEDALKNIKYQLSDKSKIKRVNYNISLPQNYLPLSNKLNTPHYRNAESYLLKIRKLTNLDIERFKIGYCEEGKYAGRLIIPSYDTSGILNYFVARSFYESDHPYLNPKISKNTIIFESRINWSLPVKIVEGMFDSIAVPFNSIPLLGTEFSKKLMGCLLTHKPDVYLILDSDAIKKTIQFSEQLILNGLAVNYVPLPEGKDPSKLGVSEMEKMIDNNSMKLNFKHIIKMKLYGVIDGKN